MTTENVVEETVHSHLGASGAPRWIPCPGSIALENKVRPTLSEKELVEFDKPNVAASEGSAAHHVAAQCLDKGQDSWEMAGTDVLSDGIWFDVDDEMVTGVQVYLDEVRKRFEQHAESGAKLYVESSMASVLHDDAYGTADAIIYVPGERVIVIDFKYGSGVVVEPTSDQLKYYGYLACEAFDITDDKLVVELVISQPRIPHPKGLNRLFVTNFSELQSWFLNDCLNAMAETKSDNPVLRPGQHQCQFCKVTEYCPALREDVLRFDATMEPEHLTNEQIGDILDKQKLLTKYFATVKTLGTTRAKKGETVPGFKLVRTSKHRVFKAGAEEEAKATFGDDAYNPASLKSPPNIEKLEGGKRFVSKWSHKPVGDLTIVPLSDKKVAVNITGEDLFGDDAT
jgi:hypothetical protein